MTDDFTGSARGGGLPQGKAPVRDHGSGLDGAGTCGRCRVAWACWRRPVPRP